MTHKARFNGLGDRETVVNVTATLSPTRLRVPAPTPCGRRTMSSGLGMEIVDIRAGQATLTMIVRPDMVNGQRIAHGGFIFLLADSTFAFACNSRNERAVAAQCQITFIKPAKLGDKLIATAREISRSGRSGIYDIRVTANDLVIAEFRGHSRTIPAHGYRCQAQTAKKNRLRKTRDGFDEIAGEEQRLLCRDGRDRARLARRDHSASDQASRVVARARLRQCRALQKGVRQGGRASARLRAALRSREIPVHRQDRPARQLSFQHVRGAARKVVRVHASSGTTGKPIVVGYTQADLDIWSDVMARSIRAAGGRTGMIIHNAYGYGLFTGGLGAHYGAERLGCTVVPVSGGMTERQVQLINDFRPDIIMVTPSYMLAILDEFGRQKLDPRDRQLKFGIFGAEPWTNALRAEIEAAFGMDADRHLRPVGGDRSRRRAGMRGNQGRAAYLGGSFLSRGD